MESPDLGVVQQALRSVQTVIEGRLHATPTVPYFEPTNIGGLPPAQQKSEQQIKEEIAWGNQLRAGIQMSLATAAASLRVCSALMKDSAEATYAQRIGELQRCAAEAEKVVDLAKSANAILAGRAVPKPDPSTDIRKLSASVFRRFGQP